MIQNELSVFLFCALTAAAFLFGEELVSETSDDATENGSDPEEPKLFQSGTADENRNGSRTGRIHGSVRHRNADEMNQGEAKTDGDRSKTSRSAAIGSAHEIGRAHV